jgi:dTDP-4-dehydrorhamnose 3,5-epimerase
MENLFVNELEGVKVIDSSRSIDARGSTTKLVDSLRSIGLEALDNLLLSRNTSAGTLRGLHFQKSPNCESKIVTCITGKVMDYVVDLRPDSKTFGKWSKNVLDANKPSVLVIPKGFAHGYQTLEPDTWILYGIDKPYSAADQIVISFFDSDLSIPLELEISHISKRDLDGISMNDALTLLQSRFK